MSDIITMELENGKHHFECPNCDASLYIDKTTLQFDKPQFKCSRCKEKFVVVKGVS